MVRRDFAAIWTLSTLLVAMFLLSFSPTLLAGNTILYVDPPAVGGLNVGDTFKINVTVSNVADLYGWQFSLFYRGDVLNATLIQEGPFLKTHPDGENTFFLTPVFTDSYNATYGLIIATSTLSGVKGGVNGSGTLATVTFKVKQSATSTLHLAGTTLADSAEPFGNRIAHSTQDGIFYSGVRDVAVVNVQISSISVYVGQTVRIDVTVANLGTHTETFDVTTYYDLSVIARKTVNSLAASSQSTLSFDWNTTGVETDRAHTIKAVAAAVPGETRLDNNVFIDGSVTVRAHVPFAIRIVEAVPCNESGYPTTRFDAGSMGHFKVTVESTSLEPETVLVTVNVGDSSNTTLGVVSFKGTIMPGTSTFILGLPIASTVSKGFANVYADAFTDWLYFGGVPYCPEVSATFEIVSP